MPVRCGDNKETMVSYIGSGHCSGWSSKSLHRQSVKTPSDTHISVGHQGYPWVLQKALEVWDLQVIPLHSPVAEPAQVDPELENAFICHLQDHWFCIRKVNGEWYNFDSLYAAPEHLSRFYLSAYLDTLKGFGWSIFIVRGNFPKECPMTSAEATNGYGQWLLPEDAERIIKSSSSGQRQQHHQQPPRTPPTEDDDLNAAIAASLRENGGEVGTSMNSLDDDLAAAIAASLKESSPAVFSVVNKDHKDITVANTPPAVATLTDTTPVTPVTGGQEVYVTMTRKKVKLAFIINDSARKATFKKRKKGLMKKVSELSTLCGIDACAIIYSPYEAQPEVWPNNIGVQRVIAQFKRMPEMEQSKKMVNQESFIRQRITKANEQLKKQIKENQEKEMTEVMYQCLTGRGSIANLTLPDLNHLGGLVDQTLKDICTRIESLKKVVPAGIAVPSQPPRPQATVAGSSPSITTNEMAKKGGVSFPYMVDNASSLDLMQKTQWFADWINNPSGSQHTIDLGPGYHESNSFANNLNPVWPNPFFS
ncbi:agamous-like MADS-box protein AGL80 [Tanacetum coccineum]|uniref:ubiquitinyl hydrolase 1 n=1 Tax=Tanacetum coccineum TaxID=301880 RepID=A0ABQ5B9T6_9ASTR